MAEAKDLLRSGGGKQLPDSGQRTITIRACSLNALGQTDQARQGIYHRGESCPGDKVIWDSPALRPFGNPEAPKGSVENIRTERAAYDR